MRTKLVRIATAFIALAAHSGAAHSAGPAPAPGTISVDTKSVAPDLAASIPAFVDAVGKALTDRGFTMLEGAGHAGLVADLRLSRVEVGTAMAKVPTARSEIGPGGAAGVGAEMSIALPTAKMTAVPLQQIRLEIRIEKRGDDRPLWQGAAITIRTAGRDKAVAADLADALFRGYPAQPEDVISVP